MTRRSRAPSLVALVAISAIAFSVNIGHTQDTGQAASYRQEELLPQAPATSPNSFVRSIDTRTCPLDLAAGELPASEPRINPLEEHGDAPPNGDATHFDSNLVLGDTTHGGSTAWPNGDGLYEPGGVRMMMLYNNGGIGMRLHGRDVDC